MKHLCEPKEVHGGKLRDTKQGNNPEDVHVPFPFSFFLSFKVDLDVSNIYIERICLHKKGGGIYIVYLR